MAEVSMKRHNRAKQLVVIFNAAVIDTRGGWGADVMLRACSKVVCRPRGTDQRQGKVVLVDEFRTSRGLQCSAEYAALSMQRIGDSRWHLLQLCWWPDLPALPAKGKEFHELGHKRVLGKPPKTQKRQQQQHANGMPNGQSNDQPLVAALAAGHKASSISPPVMPQETKLVFEKLFKFIGKNIKSLVDRPDEPHCFRLQKNRVYYVRESLMKKATNIARDKLVHLGTCIGKLTHTGKFRLAIGALDILSQHAKYKIWVKPSVEMQFLYGNHILKGGLGRITESTPTYTGAVVYSMSDLPLGFGVTAKSTDECRTVDPGAIVAFHQADVGGWPVSIGVSTCAQRTNCNVEQHASMDCNAALNMQRIGESRWRPLELCYWPDQGALPAKGKEYPGLGYKRVRDKLPKAQEQQQPAEAQMLAARLVSDAPMETSQILVPVELQHVQPDILEAYVRQRQHQLLQHLLSRLAPDAANAVTQLLSQRPPERGERLALRFKHTCRFLGCTNVECQLCKNNPTKRCPEGDNLDEAYADSTILRSKCEADIYVELFSTVTGQICRSLGDGEVQVSIIDGDSWTEAAPGNMSTVRELLKSDEASCQQPGMLADAGSLPPKQSSSWSETRCKRPHHSQAAGRWQQLWSGLARAGCQCNCGPRPVELPATPYDKQREMCQCVLAPVCAQGGQARLPDLSVHDKNDTFHWQGASYSTFRLMGRCPNTEIQPAISHKFVVKTQRALNDYRKSEWVLANAKSQHGMRAPLNKYPHYKDELTRLKYIGSITAQRLRDVQAHLDCNVPFTCIETVEQMKHLMMFADTNRLVENKLLELLNFRGKHKHKWDYLRATLNHIVYDDNAHRAWLLPEGGSDPGSLGLLFTCRQGQVNLDKPAGVIYRVPHLTGAGHILQVAWRRSAEQAWLTPGHPGWSIAQDPMEFVSSSGGLGAPGSVSPALSGHDAMDDSQACLMRRTSAASSPLPRLVNPLAAMQLSLGLRAGAGLLGGSTNSDPAACTGSEAATAPHHSRSSSLRRVGSVRSNGYAGSDGLQYTVSEAGMDPMLRHSRVSNGSTGDIQAREHPTGAAGYGHGMDAPGPAGLPPLSRSRHLPQSQRSQEGTLAHVFDVDACDPDFLLALDASAFDVKELTSAMQYHGNLNSPGAHFSEALSLGLGLDHGPEQHGVPGLLGSAGQHMQHAVQQASNSGSVPGLEPGPGLQPREMSFAHFAMGQAAPDPGRATTGAPFHQFPLSDSFTQTLRRMMHHFDAEACKPEHTMHPGDGTPAA
ncbi:hypothetical protein QJQ45_014324 [Haematococcus lacustris]|nr:hypothetical protein QJQ45_014324 [Haematococcus lacustris]